MNMSVIILVAVGFLTWVVVAGFVEAVTGLVAQRRVRGNRINN